MNKHEFLVLDSTCLQP